MLLNLIIIACGGSEPAGPDEPPPTGPTTGPPHDPEETGDPTDSDLPASRAATLRLHDEIRSLVYAAWDQPADATSRVEYSFDPGVWLASPDRETAAGPTEALLLGIPYDVDLEVRVVTDTLTAAALEPAFIRTDPLPEQFPAPTLLAEQPILQEPAGRYLLGSINGDTGGWTSGPYWMFVLDRLGRVVWAKRGIADDMTIYLQISLDGDILWDQATFWSAFDQGLGSRIHRMKIDGVETEVLDAPGLHHAFVELPDRSIAWGSAQGFDSELLRKRAPDGTVTTVWDCRPFYASLGLVDWCHTNSITYDAATDRYLLSFPTDETFVLEVDGATGAEIRWFGHIPQSYAFDEPDSAFQYQHGTTWTSSGTLLLSSQRTASDEDALAREYTVDDATRTLTQIWSFGAGDGIDATNAGEAHRLANGNTLHNTGTDPRVREITPAGEVAWDVVWPGDRLLGRTVLIEDLYDLAP